MNKYSLSISVLCLCCSIRLGYNVNVAHTVLGCPPTLTVRPKHSAISQHTEQHPLSQPCQSHS